MGKNNKKRIVVFIDMDLDKMIKNNFVFNLRIKSNLDSMDIQTICNVQYIVISKCRINDLYENDIFIFARAHFFLSSILQLVKFLKKNRKIVLYDIDDYYLGIPPYSFSSHFNWGGRDKIYINNLKLADIIITSTEYLKKNLSVYNKNTFVIENTLDYSEFRKYNKIPDKVGIFISSNDNLKINAFKNDFIKCLQELKKKYGNKIEIIFLGKFSNIKNIENIAEKLFDRMPPESYNDFLNSHNINIGLVPLGSIEDPDTLIFHSCKSNIKFLEFARFGIAGVYSNVEPYKFIQKKRAGLIVNNNFEEWFEALQKLIDNPALCYELVKNSQIMARESFLKSNSQLKLLKILNLIKVNKNIKESNRLSNSFFIFFLIIKYKKNVLFHKIYFFIMLIKNGKYKEIFKRIKNMI